VAAVAAGLGLLVATLHRERLEMVELVFHHLFLELQLTMLAVADRLEQAHPEALAV
jgi:hypothetical protein